MHENDNFMTSHESMKCIISELKEVYKRYESSRSIKQDIREAFSSSSVLPWPYVLLTIVIVVVLFIYAASFRSAVSCAIFLLLTLVVNSAISVWERRKKRNELLARIKRCMKNLKDVCQDCYGDDDCLKLEEFSNLLHNCETSAVLRSLSHSISYVYRNDDTATPIPTALLATEDNVALWPGQESPAKIACARDQCCVLEIGEVFNASHIQLCSAACNEEENIKSHRFKVLESPIITEVSKFMSSLYALTNKPLQLTPYTLFERQRRYFLLWFLKFVIPLLLIISYIVSTVRYFQLSHTAVLSDDVTLNLINFSLSNNNSDAWYSLFFEVPSMLCIPFLPILLPGLMTILLTVGEAKTLNIKHERSLVTQTTLSSQAVFFKNKSSHSHWWHLLPKLLWSDDGTNLHRNAGLFVPLGSLTVLCCVDKEGILSWFNPIAEKVFFFKHEKSGEVQSKSKEETSHPVLEAREEDSNIPDIGVDEQQITSETLTLSQDSRDPSCIQFDDVRWEDNLSSLKPIGLNILLNLCSCSVDENTCPLTDSNISESIDKKDESCHAQPNLQLREKELSSIAHTANCLPTHTSITRKGLCSLTELVGFHTDIKLAFTHMESLTAYKKSYYSTLLRISKADHSLSSEHFELSSAKNLESVTKRSKWKQHLPHLHATLVQDLFGERQVVTYGTGDLMVDNCKYVWDGQDVRRISLLDKRKAVDFYQKNSVTGLCIAFGYMPLLTESKDSVKMSSVDRKLNKIVNLSKNNDRRSTQLGFEEAEVLGSMVFLGMTTLQHQARFSVCQLVDTVERACIRFVYFSSDNEVKSRVFGEKMGLETGWNCHISLGPAPMDSLGQEVDNSQRNRSESSKSKPSSEAGHSKHKPADEHEVEDMTSPSSLLLERMSPRTQSECSTNDSLFNDPNRAKLPRGIQNIVPHIENVDNVPLLVPLFTDATPESACEMIKIMQDYGEIVCCIGSSDCIRNISVFHQAHVSLPIEPLIHPSRRSQLPDHRSKSDASSSDDSDKYKSSKCSISHCIAMETARKLHCLPCSLLLSGDGSLNILSAMITQARHFLFLLRIFFAFLMKCQIASSSFQLLAHVFLLPSPFMPMDIFWMSFVIFPCLSATLLGSQPDRDLMTWGNQKTLPKDSPITRFMLRQSTKRFLAKFLPSVCVLLTCYTLCLHSTCIFFKHSLQYISSNSSNGSDISTLQTRHPDINVQCYPHFLLTVSSTNDFGGSVTTSQFLIWDIFQFQVKKRAIQLTISCFLVLYMCIVSIGYVHRWKRLSNTPPFSNKLWCLVVPILISFQVVGSIVAFAAFQGYKKTSGTFPYPGPDDAFLSPEYLNFGPYNIAIWTILAVWPLPCIGFNELWKLREIKMWNRGQKRARLNFNTKLGMNSPF